MERMLTIFRRHSSKCPHAPKGRAYTKCSCPCWVDGNLPRHGRILESLHTRNWTLANRRALDMEMAGQPLAPQPATEITTAEAIEKFHADQIARQLAESSIKKFRQTTARLLDMAKLKGCRVPKQITAAMLREMRATWTDAPITHQKHLERLRQVFRFFASNGWISENPATGIKAPLVEPADTLPLEPAEIQQLLAACDSYPFPAHEAAWRRRRAIAFLHVLRFTGLRLGDAVRLHRDSIDDQGRITVAKMGKTKRPVKMPVPSFVLSALSACEQPDGTFFLTGSSGGAAENAWDKWLKRLAQFASVPNVHAHRFRDTFSVELLKAGTPIEDVSRLLGHRSIRTTEKHYAPWVVSRQESLDRVVRRALGIDTPAIQGPKENSKPT